MNGDPSKPEIGYAQTYFAIQTRRQEQQDGLADVERRRDLRGRVKDANKGLNSAAKRAGILRPQQFAIFHSEGYKGLYGMGLDQVKEAKRIGQKEDLLDRAGHVELAANYFRITQTEQRMGRDAVKDERRANRTHFDVGRKVRDSMFRISGTRPERLPAEISLKGLGRDRRSKQLARSQ